MVPLIDVGGGRLVEEADLIVLGGGHYLQPTTCHAHPEAGVTGYIETHPRLNGDGPDPCAGGLSLRGHGHGNQADGSPRPEWDLVSAAPLALAPSILCTDCGRHGFVRDGAWVEA